MKKKIMIIEDDLNILELIQLTLEGEGYKVEGLCDGCDLVLGDRMPDLILLDILLPGVSGEEIAASLKSDSKTQNLPIILVSGHSNLRSIAKRVKADDYLEKPFELDDLIMMVGKYLQ